MCFPVEGTYVAWGFLNHCDLCYLPGHAAMPARPCLAQSNSSSLIPALTEHCCMLRMIPRRPRSRVLLTSPRITQHMLESGFEPRESAPGSVPLPAELHWTPVRVFSCLDASLVACAMGKWMLSLVTARNSRRSKSSSQQLDLGRCQLLWAPGAT